MVKIMLKFPDGTSVEVPVVTSYEKNNKKVLMIDTGRVDNGHKVVGVCCEKDGLYQNIIAPNEWDEVKSDLVDILKDTMDSSYYRVTNGEVAVSVDYKHDLALRSQNFDKIAESYDNFLKNQQTVTQSDGVGIMDINIDNVVPTNNQVPPVNELPVMDTIPVVNTTPQTLGETPNLQMVNPTPEVVPETATINPFAPNLNQTIEDQVVDNQMVNQAPVIENNPSTINETITPTPGVDVSANTTFNPEPISDVVDASLSPVQEDYINRADNIVERVESVSKDFQAVLDKLIVEMKEMRTEMVNNLEEAKKYNELSKQTFDNSQANVQPVQQPNPQSVFPTPQINPAPQMGTVNQLNQNIQPQPTSTLELNRVA